MPKSIESLSLERRVDALFSRYTRPGSPGAVVAVARRGEIVLAKGYGLASISAAVTVNCLLTEAMRKRVRGVIGTRCSMLARP